MALTCDRLVNYQSHMFNQHNDHEHISIKLEPHCPDYFTRDSMIFSAMAHGSGMEFKHKPVLSDPVSPQLTSWTTKHPQHWTKREVLDWIFFVVEQEHLDGSKLQGEAYSNFLGEDLCKMNRNQFIRADPYYGSKMYETFRNLINDVSFEEPKPALDVAYLDNFNNINNLEYTGLNRNINRGVTGRYSGVDGADGCDDISDVDLLVYHSDTDIKVTLPGLGIYPISPKIELPSTNSSMPSVLPSKLRDGEAFTQPLLHQGPSQLPQFSSLSSHLPSPSMATTQKHRASSSSSSSSSDYLPSSTHTYTYSSTSKSNSNPVHTPSSTSPSSGISSLRMSSSSSSSAAAGTSLSLSLSLSLPQGIMTSPSLSPCRMDKTDHGYSSDDSSTSYMAPYHQTSSVNTRTVNDDMELDINHSGMFASSAFTDDCPIPKKKDKKNRNNATKNGNHLWEFVRDLLRDPKTNPKLLKWEDKDHGVFRFVQSEKVAQLWGEKKNNPLMTYEKLSRAMRFCRTAGYFDSVPKTGKFPKKLCFMFGEKAHGWRD